MTHGINSSHRREKARLVSRGCAPVCREVEVGAGGSGSGSPPAGRCRVGARRRPAAPAATAALDHLTGSLVVQGVSPPWVGVPRSGGQTVSIDARTWCKLKSATGFGRRWLPPFRLVRVCRGSRRRSHRRHVRRRGLTYFARVAATVSRGGSCSAVDGCSCSPPPVGPVPHCPSGLPRGGGSWWLFRSAAGGQGCASSGWAFAGWQ